VPRSRFLKLPLTARERLLRIATKHFAERGFERASLNEILAEAGLSKGSYYYYFDDKDDLFATTLESATDSLLAKLPLPPFERLTKATFWSTVERFVRLWAASFDTSSELFQVAFQLTEAQRRSPRYAPVLAKGQAVFRSIIGPGQRLGCIREDLPVDVLVRLLEANDTALDGIFLSRHAHVTREILAEHTELVLDTFKRLLMVWPRRPRPRRRRG
jgi:AcrR family transcriptional regulator